MPGDGFAKHGGTLGTANLANSSIGSADGGAGNGAQRRAAGPNGGRREPLLVAREIWRDAT